jgi:hypothetical protein
MYNYGLTRKFNIMTKEIYIVTFSSANYAGAPEYCAVMADSEEDAISNEDVYEHAETYYREQDEEQYQEETDGECCDCYASIDSAIALVGSEFEEYYANEEQRRSFYPMVG